MMLPPFTFTSRSPGELESKDVSPEVPRAGTRKARWLQVSVYLCRARLRGLAPPPSLALQRSCPWVRAYSAVALQEEGCKHPNVERKYPFVFKRKVA